MNPIPNAVSALPAWIRRIAAPITLVIFHLPLELKTSILKFDG